MKILFISVGIHEKNLNALKMYNNEYHDVHNVNDLKNINLNDYDCVYSPHIPINVSEYPHTKFIFGPHFSVFPEKNKMDIIRQSKNVIYIQPSEWAKNVWTKNSLCNGLRIETLPFGLDTHTFSPDKSISERDKVFIYCKRRQPHELHFLLLFLQKFNINYKIFDYVNRYSEKDYIDYLKQSKYGIWLDAHESQGFALEEALSCDVPLLVWNIRYMSQECGSNYDDIPATTIPYWDNRCGEYFYEYTELENAFNEFIKKIETYKPREYILENLSIKKCEEKFINLINNI